MLCTTLYAMYNTLCHVPHTKWKSFSLVKIESNDRRKNKCNWKIEFIIPQTTKWRGGKLELPWPFVRLSVCPSVLQFFFSYSFAHTALKFIHNVCVHMKLCICNYHDHTIIGCGITFPWTCKLYWIIVVQRNNPTALHVLNSKLQTMLLVVYSSSCAIFITVLSLVAELSLLELVNFMKSLLSRALLLHFCTFCSEIYT